jgi:peptidoglycan/xylan/chitin deacetylase (PgdA/CDA1 family)
MTILCYHSVEPGWSSPMAVEPAAFREHCDWLARSRTVVPLSTAAAVAGRDGNLPGKQAALTFDDGFAGVYEHAFPTLARLRLPATVFLVAQTLTEPGTEVDWVDTPPAHRLATLTRDQVLEMQSAGVTFESHSLCHADLTRMSYDECVRDLATSRELLSSVLGREVRMLAYPRGRHNGAVRSAARRAGYSHAFTLPETREPVGPLAIPRVGIYRGNGMTRVRLKSSGPYLRLRTGAGYRAVTGTRRALRRTRGQP